MHLYVRDEVRSNEESSEESSKAARATRSEQAAHMPRCLLSIARPSLNERTNARTNERTNGRKSCQHRAKIKEKSTQEPSKMTVGAVLGGFERSKSFEGRSRTRSERLWCASWGVLAAKLAVLAAMLAVLDGKLAAQDGPNAVWSRPRALFERMRAIDRRRERSEDDFSSISCCRAKAAMCLAYQFLQCFVGFARS